MTSVNAALALLISHSRANTFSTTSAETIGYFVGLADGLANRRYDDTHVVPHRFTVFVPDIGPSHFAIGYRRGYNEGQADRLHGRSPSA